MRIFLTGASGFLGSYFLRNALSVPENRIAVLLRSPAQASRIQECLPRVSVIHGDLGEVGKFEGQVKLFQPDAFVHLAWTGVLGSDRNMSAQWQNVPSTLELIGLASRVGARHWVALGSQAEYGRCQNKIDEKTPTNPTTLYGASKLGACNLGMRLCEELGIRFAWIRLFSSYGPGDNPSWLIPNVIMALLAKKKPSVTMAEQHWDYIYVEDAVSAIDSVLKSGSAAGIFNLGSGHAYELRSVIERIRNFINPDLPIGFGDVPYRTDQVMHLEADITRLVSTTGWSPNVDIDTGLRRTIDWYSRRSNGN